MNFRRASGVKPVPAHISSKSSSLTSSSLDSLLAKNNARVDAATRASLLAMADGFIDEMMVEACKLAQHRNGDRLV
jgi:transcription initiation factor TFIID subunit TAF12